MISDETPEDRLEAALERIARLIDAPGRVDQTGVREPVGAGIVQDAALKLDGIIATLRDALGK